MDELLSLIKNSKVISMPELESKLGMSREMIFARLERYAQLGYVRRIVEGGASCSGACGSCKGCGSHKMSVKPSVFWVKGEKLK